MNKVVVTLISKIYFALLRNEFLGAGYLDHTPVTLRRASWHIVRKLFLWSWGQIVC